MKILVIGDIAIDRYYMGEVERISPEAPVPVVRYQSEDNRAGCAANVAMNCAAMGAQVSLLGIVGEDHEADIVRGIVSMAGVKQMLMADGTIRTIQKLRVVGRGQQIVRIDFEKRPSKNLMDEAQSQIPYHDIIVLSDYDKGVLDYAYELTACGKQYGKVVLVDPKGSSAAKYAGAFLLKPNQHEMRDMVGGWKDAEELRRKADDMRRSAGIENVLVTQASEGMTLFHDGVPLHVESQAREVYDVTGAGDTVIAAVAAMLAMGKGLFESIRIANRAAGIVVAKFGTAVCSLAELNIDNEPVKP